MRRMAMLDFIYSLFTLAAVWLLPASLSAAEVAPQFPGRPPAQEPTPEEVAQGYLKQACAWGFASEKLAQDCNPRAIEGFYAAAEAAWNAVWTCPGSPEVLCEAATIYAEALEGLLASADSQGRLTGEGLLIGPTFQPLCVPIQTRGLELGASSIERIIAVPAPADNRISRRHQRGGFGLPVSLRCISRQAAERAYAPPRQSVAATAVLRFTMPGNETRIQKLSGPLARNPAPAILDLADPVEIAAVNIGAATPMLAADLTAPLLDMLEGMPKDNLRDFVQPYGRGDTKPKLEFLQPHQPGRIPVVFIHGLASDEGTWFDLINELRTSPTFHSSFEPWVYHYPTGASFLQSAAVLRRELTAAVRQLDPAGTDKALSQMVLIGHSMGGLHAKLQVVDPGNSLWNAISYRPYDQVTIRPEIRQAVGPGYFFKPLPFVKRVVYIATPHAGSSLASLGIGRIASCTVQQPKDMVAIHDEVVAANPGAFHPDYVAANPTTVDILRPSSTILRALHDLRPPCWVTAHTILGVSTTSLISGPGDCVVPASSAQLPGVVSEVTVPAKHTQVHHHPISILEIERILAQHLQETGQGAARGL